MDVRVVPYYTIGNYNVPNNKDGKSKYIFHKRKYISYRPLKVISLYKSKPLNIKLISKYPVYR